MRKFWKDKEFLLIVVAWAIAYAMTPLYVWYQSMQDDFGIRWEQLSGMWGRTTLFLLLYLIHHIILAHKFFFRKRYIPYAVSLCLCMTAFTAILVSHKPEPFMHKRPDREMRSPHDRPHDMRGQPRKPRNMLSPPDVASLIIALMMIGVDLGSVAWLNSQKLRQRLLLLEQQNLKQELEHLRYQINPHFFMNTLNNIHVLVDIDQERAKRAIIELSGLMRHSLYNGSESMTPLQNEIEFLRQYISLMELRFGNRVELTTHLPDSPSRDIMMPPLLFATFVENAFKHGISYQAPSFIDISLTVDTDKRAIDFKCINSCSTLSAATQDGYHGIGLSNVRKRLDLQYGSKYSLDIKGPNMEVCESTNDAQHFIVSLTIPIENTV